MLQVSFVILFGPSRSAVSCKSGASKASGTGSEPSRHEKAGSDRVGPNKITDETWGKFNGGVDLLQVSFVILFGPSRSAVSCKSGASKASGTGSEPSRHEKAGSDRVGPNKITDETWGKFKWWRKVCKSVRDLTMKMTWGVQFHPERVFTIKSLINL